jgi:hypothetical protein
VHPGLVGDDDQSQGARIAQAESGPCQRTIGILGEGYGERKLGGPGDGGDLSYLNRARLALEDEGEGESR